MLTREDVQKALPPNLKTVATQAFTDKINQISADPLVAEQIRANFVSFTSVLKDGRYHTDDYLNAVTYVSYKLQGLSNQDAYFKTFPQRHQSLVAKGTSAKDISTYVSAYSRGKLVNAVLEQSAIPTWVLNQDIFQAAINAQVRLMNTSASELVQQKAADSLMLHLKRPETKDINLNLGVQESSGLIELQNHMRELAQKQREAIENGMDTRLIAGQPIHTAEFEEVDPTQTIP